MDRLSDGRTEAKAGQSYINVFITIFGLTVIQLSTQPFEKSLASICGRVYEILGKIVDFDLSTKYLLVPNLNSVKRH